MFSKIRERLEETENLFSDLNEHGQIFVGLVDVEKLPTDVKLLLEALDVAVHALEREVKKSSDAITFLACENALTKIRSMQE